ncbi:unnamed protein product [Gongylonema pulchrum]|uniref:Uncharacterized protein n=1 Tax=Gongylonema pulchrum TaxID=637853 RepID=A0A183E6V3_9BILA|nr:unnamed protein product [Gongylonema pulchrum]
MDSTNFLSNSNTLQSNSLLYNTSSSSQFSSLINDITVSSDISRAAQLVPQPAVTNDFMKLQQQNRHHHQHAHQYMNGARSVGSALDAAVTTSHQGTFGEAVSHNQFSAVIPEISVKI